MFAHRRTRDYVYAARIALETTSIVIGDKTVTLAPGMAVTVEIKAGTRRVIDYVLSPMLRYQHESLRER